MKIWYFLGALIALFALIYYFVPVVRYYLIPLTRGTAAPRSLLTKRTGTTPPTPQTGLFANEIGLVANIDDVPEQNGWINSTPLSFADLYKENKLVLIDFWTYSCINCVRATPYTQELWDRYKDYGLVVIGVHSPEFDLKKNLLTF